MISEIDINQYNYELPEERIAKYPCNPRNDSKLLIYKNGKITDSVFNKITDFLPEDSLLIFNDTKVIPARINFQKESGANIEIFCLQPVSPSTDWALAMQQTKSCVWECFVGNAKRWKSGNLTKKLICVSNETVFNAKLIDKRADSYLVEFSWDNEKITFSEILNLAGFTPLPPYIHRHVEPNDKETYQTIYAKDYGSVAAPTAGLHFTDEEFKNFYKKNIKHDFLTLQVGAGTFKPVKESISNHIMHSEVISFSISFIENLLSHIPKPIVLTGTTSIRALESLYWHGVKLIKGNSETTNFSITQWEAYSLCLGENISLQQSLEKVLEVMKINKLETLHGSTNMMITPGYEFRCADAIVTNFHQPKSTLLMLVSAFIGDEWKDIYQHALTKNYRFLSYGDACLFFKKN